MTVVRIRTTNQKMIIAQGGAVSTLLLCPWLAVLHHTLLPKGQLGLGGKQRACCTCYSVGVGEVGGVLLLAPSLAAAWEGGTVELREDSREQREASACHPELRMQNQHPPATDLTMEEGQPCAHATEPASLGDTLWPHRFPLTSVVLLLISGPNSVSFMVNGDPRPGF